MGLGSGLKSLMPHGSASWFGGEGASWSNLTPGGILDDLTGRRNMREQNEWNLQMWNLQNAYNTPAAQMARYKEAGLNPNLIYGQTNTAGPVHASASAEGLGGAFSKVGSLLSAIYGIKQMKAGIRNVEEQNNNIKSQNSLLQSQEEFTKEQIRRYAYETNWLMDRGLTSFSHPTEKLGRSLLGTVGAVGEKILPDVLHPVEVAKRKVAQEKNKVEKRKKVVNLPGGLSYVPVLW